MFLKIYHSQYTCVFYNIILLTILRFSFVSCQCYTLMRHSTLRFSFVLVRNFRLCAISLCDFQFFPIFVSNMFVHSQCPLHLILVIILACTLFYLFAKITLLISLLITIFQLLQVSLTIFTYFLCSILVSKCAIYFAIFVCFLSAIVVHALLYSVENITFAIQIFIAILLSKLHQKLMCGDCHSKL